MNISIIGYGGVGREIERIALAKGIGVKSIIDPVAKEATHKEISKESLKEVDVAIDFTSPSVAVENIRKVCRLKTNMVVGTTGWYTQLPEVKKLVQSSKVGFIYGSNFSVGVHAYFRIIKEAAKLFNNLPDYDIWGNEMNNYRKADSP